MTVWQIVLLASVAVLALKVAGYLVPPSLMERPTPARVANLTTVGLLAALVVTQTFERSGGLVLDARVPAVVLAGILFAFRVPFIVVILVAALTAAGLRLLGWMA
ncbi:AzlD domain-containing protein [Pseudolysinimonas sp.]